MMVICPECSTRYVMGASALGPAGRKVRCASCGHVWHQVPDESIHDDAHLDPIPESIRPIPEGSSVPSYMDHGEGEATGGRNFVPYLVNYGFALVLFFVILLGLYTQRHAVVRMWEPMALFYERIGHPVPVAGSGLVFDRVNAVTSVKNGRTLLNIDGYILNLTSETVAIPRVRAVVRDHTGRVVHTTRIAMDRDFLEAEKTMTFHANYEIPTEDNADYMVTVSFVD